MGVELLFLGGRGCCCSHFCGQPGWWGVSESGTDRSQWWHLAKSEDWCWLEAYGRKLRRNLIGDDAQGEIAKTCWEIWNYACLCQKTSESHFDFCERFILQFRLLWCGCAICVVWFVDCDVAVEFVDCDVVCALWCGCVICGLWCDLWTVVQRGFVIWCVDWYVYCDVVCVLWCGCDVICGL